MEIEKAHITAGKTSPFVLKSFGDLQDSVSRLTIMEENMQAAITTNDQQAMLSLLANHLGMTMGLAKGARITQAIIREAEASAPFLQRLEARFDDQGLLTGVVLTPQQMESMVALAHNRLQQDQRKFQEIQTFAGAQGCPPMNPATGGGPTGAPNAPPAAGGRKKFGEWRQGQPH